MSVVNNQPARTKRKITHRPFSNDSLQLMQEWIVMEEWNVVESMKSAHSKVEVLQNLLLTKYYKYFPDKSRIISSDDQPFFNEKLSKLKRRKCREFQKNRRSSK